MKKEKKKAYEPEQCQHCGQTTTYEVALDRGTALIVLAVYNAVKRLGKNDVHLRDDMEVPDDTFPGYSGMVNAGFMTSKMVHNVPRARYHGLVAYVEKGSNRFLITPKGRDFLMGAEVPRVAIIDKKTHTKKYYLDEDSDRCTFGQILSGETPFWDIEENLVRKYLGSATDQGTLGV